MISRYTHNWWHVAVCYLEGCSPLDKVLEVYDCHIWNELQRSDADCGEVYYLGLQLLMSRPKLSLILLDLELGSRSSLGSLQLPEASTQTSAEFELGLAFQV